MTLTIPTTKVNLIQNPWPHTIPDVELYDLLEWAANRRAYQIHEMLTVGLYEEPARDSMGFVILDPTAAASTPSEECVLATLEIGENGRDFVPNAAAKCMQHRDRGMESGAMVYSQPHRLRDGDFRFGYSVNIEGFFIGGSGRTEAEDKLECTGLAADLIHGVNATRSEWADDLVGYYEEAAAPSGNKPVTLRWWCLENKPDARYSAVLDLEARFEPEAA